MTIIVDYRMGNLGSMQNMLKKIGHSAVISSDLEVIKKASKIVLPGVGHFATAMRNLKDMNLIDVLKEKALAEQIPFLGVCLGMQLMTEFSEEGEESGLGWVNGGCRRFQFEKELDLKIPHMGWNYVYPQKSNSITSGLNEESRFYFVHSYYVSLKNESDVLLKSNYGLDFVSGFQKDNLFGFQFHPEKSHKYGMLLLKNFMEQT